MTEGFLTLFDCIVYDLEDNAYVDSIRQSEIERYIKNGGSFLVTHDHWDKLEGPLHLIRMEKNDTFVHEGTWSTLAKVILPDHQIFHSYNDLTNWVIVNISETHQKYHKMKANNNTTQVLMKFIVKKEVKYNFLVSNKYKDGRVI